MLPITEPCTAQCTSNSGRRYDYQNLKLTQNSKISEQSLRLVLPRHFSNPWDNCKDVESLSRCREFPKVSCFPSNPKYETLWLTKDICSRPNGKRKASPTEALGGWEKSPACTDSISLTVFRSHSRDVPTYGQTLGCTCCVRLRVLGQGAHSWTQRDPENSLLMTQSTARLDFSSNSLLLLQNFSYREGGGTEIMD